MVTKEIINFLETVGIFKDLPPFLLPNIAERFHPLHFKDQEIVVHLNQQVENFYLVFKGRLEMYIKDIAGMQTHISYLLPKDYFGDFYLIYNQPSNVELIAIEDTTCLILPREDFLILLTTDPEISQHILRSLLRHLYKKSYVMEDAGQYKEKAIQFLQQNKRIGQYTNIIGSTPAVKEINASIEHIGQNDDPVLIEGEYGTGKELAARIIHSKSARANKQFISIDCERLSQETIDTQLFGDRPLFTSPVNWRGIGVSYIELAEGGTLLLKNIEALPLEIQVRIQELLETMEKEKHLKTNLYLPDIRIMATSRVNLKLKLEEGQFDSKLFQLLSQNILSIPPLRVIKRDIQELVEHFIKKYAQLYQKNVDKISEAAQKSLMAYDYNLSNVQELEEIIERAVILTRSDTVRSEHIFVGKPAAKPLVVYNLLKSKRFNSWVKRWIFPEKVRLLVAITFFIIIGASLYSHHLPFPYNDIGKLLTWSFWWPAMFLSFFFIGRFWCSVCPYATYSHLGKKIINKELNFPYKKYDYLFMTIGFLIVIWIEEASGMRDSSFKVGLLQLSILTLALIVGMIYRRDTWCRFICPLGALISTCAMASIIEVRSDANICRNLCTTYNCYKGRDDIPGCPMFQHLMYVDNNQTCKICLNCVRSCPHDNIALNIRPLANEIYDSNQLNKGLYLFVIAMMGVLIPILLMQKHFFDHSLFFFTTIYILVPFLIFYVLKLIAEVGFKSTENSDREILWRTTYAYIPLALTAHIAYQLQFLPIVHNFLFSVLFSPAISTKIVIYSKTLFSLFKVIYWLFEFIIYFKLISYLIFSFKEIKGKEGKAILVKPLIGSFIVSITLYYLLKINNYVFSLLRPVSEATKIVYSIPLFHIFQFLLILFGTVLSFIGLVKILERYKAENQRGNKILLAAHSLFIALYVIVIMLLLAI